MLTSRDQQHGAVLRQIVKHGGRCQLRQYGSGQYEVDGGKLLLVKYCGRASYWQFTIRRHDIQDLVEYQFSSFFERSFLALNCRNKEVCVLGFDAWSTVLDLESPSDQQTITVRRSKNCGFSVSGSGGELERKIPVQRFHKLFAD